MTTVEPLNLRVPVSGAVHQARWAVEQFRGLVDEWTPPAARPHLAGHADRVVAAIMAVAPPEDPNRVGYAVFQRTPVYGDRLYRESRVYTPVSAVFEELPTNALEHCRTSKQGDFVICWLTEHQ